MTLNELISNDRNKCSATKSAGTAKVLLQEGNPYTTIKKVDGTINYVFDEGFLARVLLNIENMEYQSFSKKEKTLVNKYIDFQINNGNNDADVIALDNKLGSM